jgi:hypothetical protein
MIWPQATAEMGQEERPIRMRQTPAVAGRADLPSARSPGLPCARKRPSEIGLSAEDGSTTSADPSFAPIHRLHLA